MKIAIYSGHIPSPPFIERMIQGIASSGAAVMLFGRCKSKPVYSNRNIQLYIYNGKVSTLLYLLKYSLLLLIFKPAQKRMLDKFIERRKGNRRQLKLRHYPILFHQPDILHVQWAKNISEWMWTQKQGIQLLLSLRGTHITISPQADAELASEYKTTFPNVQMHAISESMKQEAIQWGANPDRITVVRNGLKLDDFPFLPYHKSNSNTLRILMIGRAHWVKGYNYAIDALHLLDQQAVDFHCTIVGAGKEEELLLIRKQYQLDYKVDITEALDNKQLITRFQHYDVLLLPSLSEGIANVAMEAMACGLPVISTSCGGMNELITDHINGFIVPIRNSHAIANQLTNLSNMSESEIGKITKAARIKIETDFNEAHNLNQLMTMYTQLIQNSIE